MDQKPEASVCELHGVTKWYGPVIAVNNVTVRVQPGITGIVGPNGAGKTSLLGMMTGQLRPSLGHVQVEGHDAWTASAKRALGFCPDTDERPADMTGWSFVWTMSQLHGFGRAESRERTERILDELGLSDARNRRLHTYSKGMWQRVKLAQALVHAPRLLVLDEPLNGIDPAGCDELLQLLQRLASRGIRILLSSHRLEEIDHCVDQFWFLFRGHLVASGSATDLRSSLADLPWHVRIMTGQARDLATDLMAMDCVESVAVRGSDTLSVRVTALHDFQSRLTRLAADSDRDIRHLEMQDASSDALYAHLSRQSTRVARVDPS